MSRFSIAGESLSAAFSSSHHTAAQQLPSFFPATAEQLPPHLMECEEIDGHIDSRAVGIAAADSGDRCHAPHRKPTDIVAIEPYMSLTPA